MSILGSAERRGYSGLPSPSVISPPGQPGTRGRGLFKPCTPLSINADRLWIQYVERRRTDNRELRIDASRDRTRFGFYPVAAHVNLWSEHVHRRSTFTYEEAPGFEAVNHDDHDTRRTDD